MKGKVLQDTDDSQFHANEGKPHAKAVPGSISKGHVYIRLNAALVLLAEPGATVGMKTRLWNIDPKSSVFALLTPSTRVVQRTFIDLQQNPCCRCLTKEL